MTSSVLRSTDVTALTDDVRHALTAGRVAHLATINPDGSPQMSVVWVGVDGDDIVVGHLMRGRKIRNIARDPRVALSVEAAGTNPVGLANYLLIRGTARSRRGRRPRATATPRRDLPRARCQVPADGQPARRARHPHHRRPRRRSRPLGRPLTRRALGSDGRLPSARSPIESAAVGVAVAEQFGFGVALSEGHEAEHAPFDAVCIRRRTVGGDHVDDAAEVAADPRDGPRLRGRREHVSRKPVRCSGEK